METTKRRCTESADSRLRQLLIVSLRAAAIINCIITLMPTCISYAPLGSLSGSYLALFCFACMFVCFACYRVVAHV